MTTLVSGFGLKDYLINLKKCMFQPLTNFQCMLILMESNYSIARIQAFGQFCILWKKVKEVCSQQLYFVVNSSQKPDFIYDYLNDFVSEMQILEKSGMTSSSCKKYKVALSAILL